MQNVWYASSGIRKGRNKNIYFYLFPLKTEKVHKKLIKGAISIGCSGTGIGQRQIPLYVCFLTT